MASESPQNLDLLERGRELFKQGGLSLALCQERHISEGANDFALKTHRTIWIIIIELLKEPMIYLLLGCGAAYFFLGDAQEAVMLSGFLVLIMGLTIVQEAKAERALEALQQLASPRALVLRDGKKSRISGRELVREDLLFLNEGDRVGADGLILSSSHLHLDESLLTGESLPVKKECADKVYAGTTVTSGQALVLVTSIGLKTEIGLIGKSLVGEKQQSTQLEIQTRALVGQISVIASLLCLLVVVIYALTRHDWISGILTGLTLAMAILPNELPAVLTIFYSLGAWRLSQKKILTRKISSIENLGSITYLCVDKTGTLTLNQMEIQEIYADDKFIDLSSADCLDEAFHETLEYGILASKKDPYDPMELAFHRAGQRFLKNTEHLHYEWDLKKEYPLSHEQLSISHAWKPPQSPRTVVSAKGAPEAIIDLCHLNPEQEDKVKQAAHHMANKGLRVLGVAQATSELSPLPTRQHEFEFSFTGLIGIADPIRADVPDAIKQCQEAGVNVLMLTGDHKVTALSIAHQIGLQDHQQALTGLEMEQMSDADILKFIHSGGRVFSRVMPAQKLRLVNILKQAGEIVAMTGDGVNDAPALKAAHIGIAMGERGTDVAREAAHIVLLQDDFSSIIESIKAGRRIYRNIKNALAYLLSIHIPIAGMTIVPVITKFPLVLLPAHVAFLHLIIEPASSIAFEVEPADPNQMKQKPRSPKKPLFNWKVLSGSVIRGTILLGAVLGIYFIALKRNQGEAEARALVFSTLIFSNIFLIHLSRDYEKNFWSRLVSAPNKVVSWLSVFSVLLLLSSLYLPLVREIMRFSYLHFNDLALCLGMALLSTFLSEMFLEWFKKNT